MPNMDFASGLLGGYHESLKTERERRDKNSMDAAQFLLQTGRVRDYNDLLPILGGLFDPQGKGPGNKRGGKGKVDPHTLLGAFINPALAAHHARAGQPGQSSTPDMGTPGKPGAEIGSGGAADLSTPSAPAGTPQPNMSVAAASAPATPAAASPAGPRGPLMSRSEQVTQDQNLAIQGATATQRAHFQEQLKQAEQLRQTFPNMSLQQSLEAVGMKLPSAVPRWQPGGVLGKDLPVGAQDFFGEPIDPKGTYKVGQHNGQTVFSPTTPNATTFDRDLERRKSDYLAAGLDDDSAAAHASADRLKERQDKAQRLAGLIQTNQLTQEEHRRALAGEISFKDALTMANRIAMNDPSMTREDMAEFGRAIYKRFGPGTGTTSTPQTGGSVGAGEAATVPGSNAAAPATGDAASSSAMTAPALAATGASAPAPAQASAPTSRGVGPDPTAYNPAATPGLPKDTARDANLWVGKVKPGKLTAQQAEIVRSARTALQLIPHVTGPIEAAGLQNEMGVGPAIKARWKNFLYSRGVTEDQFNIQLQQYAGAVQAYVLRALLNGRPNLALQELYAAHIPDPTKDPPGLLYRKIKELGKIVNTGANVAIENAEFTPEQLAAALAKDFQTAEGPDGAGGADPLRLKARQYLMDEGKEASDQTVEAVLAKPGAREFLQTYTPKGGKK